MLSRRAGRPGLARRGRRLRDLPRPLRDDRRLRPERRPARLGRAARLGRRGRRAAGRRRRSSSSAAICRGIEQHLDHVERLGASILYLTPVFPRLQHAPLRRRLVRPRRPAARRRRGARLARRAPRTRAGCASLGDLTLNHCGAAHEWFVAAQQSPEAPERELFYFDDSLPGGYESWLGIRSLPKLDWGSPELRRRMTEVARRWLEPPYELDGWRIDVANMVGRYRELALTTGVASEIRKSVEGKLLVAEHGHDFRSDLQGDGWHGTMNYAGFLRPVWTWLRGDDLPEELQSFFWSIPVGLPRLPGDAVVTTMRELPRRAALGPPPALVDAARQPRHGALPHRRRLTRAAARRASACR